MASPGSGLPVARLSWWIGATLLLWQRSSATEFVPLHNRFTTLDITTANVPAGRKWSSACVQSLAGSSSGDDNLGNTELQHERAGQGMSVQHVLLFGGTADRIYGDTWLYDLAGNSWWQWPAVKNSKEPLPSPGARFGHTCTAGGVGDYMPFAVLFGGRQYRPYSDLWIFSARELSWQPVTPGGQVPASRSMHTTVFIGHSAQSDTYRFLMFGGSTDWNGTHHIPGHLFYLNDLWLLQVSLGEGSNFTAQWTEVQPTSLAPQQPAPRGSHVAVWAENRQSMIIVGGRGAQGYLDVWECAFSQNGSAKWTHLSPDFPGQLNRGIGYEEQTAGYWETSSCVVLFGGNRIKQNRALWAYCIDTKSPGLWFPVDTTPSISIPPATLALTSVMLGLRMYFFAGSQNAQELSLDRLWSLYVDDQVTEGVWFHLASPTIKPLARRSQSAVTVGNATMVVYGGAATDISWPKFALLANDVWVLNVTGERWTRYGEDNVTEGVDVPQRRAAHTAVVHGRYMWIFGGVAVDGSDDPVLLGDVWQWSVVTHTWMRFAQNTNILPTARRSHSAISTTESMLVYGGIANVTGDALDDLWEFTYHTSTWSLVDYPGDKPQPRFGHAAVAIDNNMVVFGGVNLGERAGDPSVWMYDSLNRSWHQLADQVAPEMTVPYFHSACSYGTKMIISGGCVVNEDIWDRNIRSLDRLSCQLEYRLAFNSSMWVFDTVSRRWEQLALQESLTSRIMQSTVMLGSVLALYGGYSLDPLHPPVRELAAIRPGCNVGQHSKSYPRYPCEPCEPGTYSGHAGSSSCARCPGQTTTPANVTATSLLNCTLCKGPGCHDNGECSVSLPSGDAVCRCAFGYMSSDACETPVYYYLIFFGVFTVLVVVLVCLVVVRVRRMQRLQRIRARKLRTSRCELARLTEAWCIGESELGMRERVDTESPGSFGKVVLADYREMPVAVKHLHPHIITSRNEKDFQSEVQFMRTLRHPNIVLFLGGGRFSKGSTIGPGGVSFIVMEYMSRGTLSALLRNAEVHIDSCQSLRFALDAAKGMRFLHGRNPPCIHRDLKGSNLLVSERWVVKVADFGEACPLFSLHKKGQRPKNGKKSSKETRDRASTPSYLNFNINGGLDVSVDLQASLGDDERTALLREGSCDLSSDVGTLMWQAPEMLRRRQYGPSADIYSFAIVLWEIAARKEPYTELPSMSSIVNYVLDGNRPMVPHDCPAALADLMKRCWHDDGSQRPTFRDIVGELDQQLESWSPQ